MDVAGNKARLSYLVEYFAADDLDRYLDECRGLFEYDGRLEYMELMSSGQRA